MSPQSLRPVWVTTVTAVGAWVGAFGGWQMHGRAVMVVLVLLAAAVVARGRRATLAALAAGAAVLASLSGWAAASRHAATLDARVAEGPFDAVGRVADEPVERDGVIRFVLGDARTQPGGAAMVPVAVEVAGDPPDAGTTVAVRGWLDPGPARIRGDPVAGVVRRAEVRLVPQATPPLIAAANLMRGRVTATIGDAAGRPARALLAGFLVGDTSQLPRRETEALRDAGLSHFVAVSGSNVALFLLGWWLVLTPLAGPRVRAAVGLVGIVVFVVITRWEPSVVRAGVMIGLVMVGRLLGAPLEPKVALGAAVTGLLLLSGDLAVNVGFQLSVAATAGVMAGARLGRERRPRWLWSTLGATVAAQAAVMPLLLVHFGSVPLVAPVANIVAAPLVTLSTALGGVGVLLGAEPLVGLGARVAGAVLGVADTASSWPQLGPGAAAVAVGLGVLARRRAWRPVVLLGAVVAVVASVLPASVPAGASVTFLAVGQGDAVVVRDGPHTMLVDGGREPAVLHAALRRQGVGAVDLLVVTHGDLDHVGGLEGFLRGRRVGRLWVADQPTLGDALDALIAEAEAGGVPVERVRRGATAQLGRVRVTVLGPSRRYLSDNDGSVVIWAESGGATLLLPADIEATAQRELAPPAPDVMLVPHHGSATSDLDWIAATAAPVAVISVGRNRFGHPSPEVVATLEASGSRVLTTLDDGDVVVPLRPP